MSDGGFGLFRSGGLLGVVIAKDMAKKNVVGAAMDIKPKKEDFLSLQRLGSIPEKDLKIMSKIVAYALIKRAVKMVWAGGCTSQAKHLLTDAF